MDVIERENDLTTRICSRCRGPIEGIFAEYYGQGGRTFGHIGPCEKPEPIAETGEATEYSNDK